MLFEAMIAAGLRVVGGLARFWATRGYFGEGRHWARTLLAAPMEDSATPGRLAGLTAAAYLAYYQDDYAEAHGLYDRALAAAQALGDKGAVATSPAVWGPSPMRKVIARSHCAAMN